MEKVKNKNLILVKKYNYKTIRFYSLFKLLKQCKKKKNEDLEQFVLSG